MQEPINLTPGRVDVWHCSTEQPDAVVAALHGELAAAEQRRAAQFRFDRPRREFIIARALLRRLLAAAMNRQPSAVALDASEHGKPRVLLPQHAPAIEFNVSHSHGLAVVAMTIGAAVGVDIECVRDKPDIERLAERFFSPLETQTLMQVPAADRRRAFFVCWTRKEAILKATGKGVSLPLDSFDTSFWPASEAKLLAARWGAAVPDKWSMANLDLGERHVGSLAVSSDHPVTHLLCNGDGILQADPANAYLRSASMSQSRSGGMR
jgi:4'-phosphopantetheinyl transferase